MSIKVASHGLLPVELNGGNQKSGDENEAKLEPEPTEVDRRGTGGLSKRHARHNTGAGNDDASPQQQGRLWAKDRSGTWWMQCNNPDYLEAKFRSHFRMGQDTFDMICRELGSVVAKEDTRLRPAIPVRKRVAICIWRLATGESYRAISDRFGLGVSTCHKIVLQVCAAIKNTLMPRFIRWPDRAPAFEGSFESISGIPNIISAMYTTHIPIIAPAPQFKPMSYYNNFQTERIKKTSYSIILQGVVGPDGTLTDICIGWPGSMTDDEVLKNSSLQQRGNSGMMAGSWVAGGSNYPLMDWLLVPYTVQNLTDAQHAFNEKVTKLRHVAVDAFARLKGRWACLQKRTEVKIDDLPAVIICEVNGEEMDLELRCDVIDDEIMPKNLVCSESASKARDKIAHKLFYHDLGDTTF
ncbi:protein ANTAGONIST OF LIKE HETEROCHROMATIN PROTEIN 1-like [Brachypodium distachyon]|uniref:protein ANTAGONIST OF LIKE HETEROCHROMATIN PROTEIN 1-like n=1 Tax=Brachypodium distachyon TaxID=15368 RepID=UPI000D0DBC18|nr:protein ANTAGONIST OF LIKE HETEROCHROMATIN PROTEIN 1-like [Brachypodium distachyon]|eukprot:XP_010232614.2 protein ANTAGONIST OF LIKE HETEROCHROMATIN PROTEIN 1-like [Brachypodium distachyon]